MDQDSKNQPPTIIVQVNKGNYCMAFKKIKDREQVKVVAEDIVGLTKTSDGDLLSGLTPGKKDGRRSSRR